MEDRASAQHGPVLHLDMSRKQAVVGDHHPVSDCGVMAHVDADHQEVVVPETRRPTLLGSAVECGVFADDVIVPDFHETGSR